jgi:hypothetical protein
MTASVNGWRVIKRAECVDVHVPGGILPVHPEFAWLAQDCAIRWHETVEPLVWPGCWAWAEPRPIRGGTVTSNHCSATAWDLCAPIHPRGVPIARTFSRDQLVAVSALETRYFGVLRWGGRWEGEETDGMHWEGIPGVSVEAVRELTAHLKATGTPPSPTVPPSSPPAPTPAPGGSGWTGPDLTGTSLALRGDEGNNGPRVAKLQDFWRTRYRAYARDLAVDGWWGPATTGVCAEFARRSGIRSADGRNIGPQLARKLYLAGFRG